MIKKANVSRPNLILRFIGAVFSGALATLSFAPYSYWPVIFLSLFVFIFLIDKQRPKHAMLIGFAWGIGQFTTGVSWVYVVIEKFGGMPLPLGLLLIGLLIGYLALYPAVFAFFAQQFSLPSKVKYWFYLPALWLVIDWLRGYLLTGFPWLWPGYSQIDSPFASFAPMLGVQGVTLMMLIFVTSLVLFFKHRKILSLVPNVLILFFATSLNVDWVKKTDNQVDVAIVQGNVPQELKWLPQYRWPTLLSYQDLTRKNWDADIIIWPEAAIPAMENELPDFLARLDSAAKNNNSALITGVLDRTEDGTFYNNVIVIGDTGEQAGDYSYPAKERYSKHHLLVFGEYVPFENILRPLAPLFNLPMSSFTEGKFEQKNLNARGYQMATAICYEIAFNEQVRRNLTEDSDFILTLSNDTWFGDSIGPFQHLEIARMRALENGKPLLRSTNTGLTAIIDHKGLFVQQIAQFETAVLRATVNTTKGQTPYTIWGDFPLIIWVGLSILACIIGFLFGQKKSEPLSLSLF